VVTRRKPKWPQIKAPYFYCHRCLGNLTQRGVGHEPYLCFDCTEEEALVATRNLRTRKSVAWTLREYRRRLVAAGLLAAVSDDADDLR
jgi:hypothetical protein